MENNTDVLCWQGWGGRALPVEGVQGDEGKIKTEQNFYIV